MNGFCQIGDQIEALWVAVPDSPEGVSLLVSTKCQNVDSIIVEKESGPMGNYAVGVVISTDGAAMMVVPLHMCVKVVFDADQEK